MSSDRPETDGMETSPECWHRRLQEGKLPALDAGKLDVAGVAGWGLVRRLHKKTALGPVATPLFKLF